MQRSPADDDYGLADVRVCALFARPPPRLMQNITGRCHVHVVSGDHDSIVQGEAYMATCKLLCEIF
jgi:hypothetical protein